MTVIFPSPDPVEDHAIDTSMLLAILSFERDSVRALPGQNGTVTVRFQLSRPPTTIEVEELAREPIGAEFEAGFDAVTIEWSPDQDATVSVRNWNKWLNESRLAAINRLSREATAVHDAREALAAVRYEILS